MLAEVRGQREVEGQVADLVAAHRRELLDLCQRRLGGDRHLAEDVVQETFLKLGRALAAGQEIQRPRAWLRTVASHGTVDELRRRGPMVLVEPPDAVGVEDIDLGGASAELETAWRGLAPRHREVLRLRELEGLHYDEIATAMATRVSAVETLLFRARSALRREYSRAAANMTTAQAQLAAVPLSPGAGDGWLRRLAGRIGGGSAVDLANRFEAIVDVLKQRAVELTATVAVGTAAVSGMASPPPAQLPALPVELPAVVAPPLDVKLEVPEVPEVPELPTVAVPDLGVPEVIAPSVVEETTATTTTAVEPETTGLVEAVGGLVDAVAGEDGLLGEILAPTARNR